MNRIKPLSLAILLLSSAPLAASSNYTPDDLGGTLTPMGAIRAGGAGGLIPEWNGGITSPPADFRPGRQHTDPFAGDQPRAVVTVANMDEHAQYLSPGHRAMLETYPDTFRLRIFPTRRSASYPEKVYEATRRNARNARLVEDGAGVSGAIMGAPFPIPQSAEEVIWNHLMRYRGQSLSRAVTQAAPNRRGNYTLVEFYDELLFRHAIGTPEGEEGANVLLYLK